MSARVDAWESVIAIALHRCKCEPGTAYKVALALDKLARIARTLHRLYEVACNEELDLCEDCKSSGSGAEDHVPLRCFYARLERLERRAEGIGAELGVIVECQRDPRGAAVKVWADKVDGRLLGVFS